MKRQTKKLSLGKTTIANLQTNLHGFQTNKILGGLPSGGSPTKLPTMSGESVNICRTVKP